MQRLISQNHLFFLLLLLPVMADAQPYLLIDRALKEPAELSQQLKPEAFAAKYFPVNSQDVDALIRITEQVIAQLDQYAPGPLEPEMVAGHTRVIIKGSLAERNKTFGLRLLTRLGDNGFGFDLLSETDNRYKNLRKLRLFLNYLRNNRLLLASALEGDNR